LQRYAINPQVIHETIDGETIIIDLQTGTYYSLRGMAPVIWNALVAGMGDEQVVAEVQARYLADPAEVDVARAFLADLAGAGLIAPVETSEPAPSVSAPSGDRIPFDPPRLEQYTDMQDIILLDPVHKVDSQGWPNPAPAAAKTT
jgi:hypothetical protein